MGMLIRRRYHVTASSEEKPVNPEKSVAEPIKSEAQAENTEVKRRGRRKAEDKEQ